MPKKTFLKIFIQITIGLIVVTLILNKVIAKHYFPHPIILDFHFLFLSTFFLVLLISFIYLLVKYDKLIIPGILTKLSRIKHLILELSTIEKIYISILAGFSEELLFRGFLQPILGITLTSILFGAVHFMTIGYFLLATCMGFFLGSIFIYSGNILVPMTVHALYDIFALSLLTKIFLKEKTTNQNPVTFGKEKVKHNNHT